LPQGAAMNESLFRFIMLGALVAFLLLAGSYVLLKTRPDDIAFHRSRLPDTEEVRRRLDQRHKFIGLTAWTMASGAVVWLIVFGSKLASYAKH
jgi:hypothetical protein